MFLLEKKHYITKITNGEYVRMDNLLRTTAIITEKYASQNMSGMWATVITGLVVVFLILGILIGFIYLIGLFSNIGKKKEKKMEKAPEAPVAEPAPVVEEEVYEEDDSEIIAVISAAIAAYGEQDGKTYAIKKIKRSEKQPRSSWGTAGVIDNTRPF